MENITFLLEDTGFFLSKIKLSENTRIYIKDLKLNEIRELDKEFFTRNKYNPLQMIYNGDLQFIFVEKCNCHKMSINFLKDFLKWKLSTTPLPYFQTRNEYEKKLKKWLLLAIGLYGINFNPLNKIINILEKEEAPYIYTFDILGCETNSKKWTKIIRIFEKVAKEFQKYWDLYDADQKITEELKSLKKILNSKQQILNLEEYKNFFEKSNKSFEYSYESKEILRGYLCRTIDGYIRYTQANFISEINSLINDNNKQKIPKEKLYFDCFKKKENSTIRDILMYRKVPEYNDYPQLKIIVEYLKKERKLEGMKDYTIDYLYISCLKFEVFKILKNYPLNEIYLKCNYHLKNDWYNKIYEKHKIKNKIYYVLNKFYYPNSIFWENETKLLYEESGEKIIKPYDKDKEQYLIGKVYSEDEIESFQDIFLLIYKTLN